MTPIGHRKISQILNGEGLKTPRGSLFKNNHVHSIYKKGKIREERINREDIVEEKRSQGFNYLQISDMMNESHFKPQRTLKFTPQQVWGLEFKMENRIKRLDKIEKPKVVSIGLINEV